tara:strand:+ start:326 stop:1060 length:735 start_codon:yes stop_codon:yes gene_type:complete
MTNKYIYFIANWKMFGSLNTLNTLDKVINFVKKLKKNKVKIIYCPPNTLINLLVNKFKNSPIMVGGQNCHEKQDYGAHTGQINSKMLKDVGAKYVILGHSENRQLGENDKLINLKIKSTLNSKLKVIFCIGETLREKNKKVTKKVLAKQILKGLKNVKNKKDILIAYEPVWAIGTGLTPKEIELSDVINFIKKRVKNVPVLYGGSVNTKNIQELKKIDNVDGFLIGGASQVSKNLIDIIKKTFN